MGLAPTTFSMKVEELNLDISSLAKPDIMFLGKGAEKSLKNGLDVFNWARLTSLVRVNRQSQPECPWIGYLFCLVEIQS